MRLRRAPSLTGEAAGKDWGVACVPAPSAALPDSDPRPPVLVQAIPRLGVGNGTQEAFLRHQHLRGGVPEREPLSLPSPGSAQSEEAAREPAEENSPALTPARAGPRELGRKHLPKLTGKLRPVCVETPRVIRGGGTGKPESWEVPEAREEEQDHLEEEEPLSSKYRPSHLAKGTEHGEKAGLQRSWGRCSKDRFGASSLPLNWLMGVEGHH